MTNKEIAERLRKLIDGTSNGIVLSEAIQNIADELDPPRPEPGTVVWWQDVEGLTDPVLGQINEDGVIVLFGTRETVELRSVKWWPARILAPDEVAVKIPPVSEWGSSTHQFAIDGYELGTPRSHRLRTITRTEAERREAEG